MEVVDIISHHVDKTQNLIVVEFRILGDDDDVIREDFIEYSYYEEFGFDNNGNFNIFESMFDEEIDEWEDESYDYMDEEKLISFLNEYYIVYPKKLPKAEFK
jgi:hypothetical protein